MTDLRRKRRQAGVVLALIALISLLRVAEGQTGPLYLIPVVMAAFWLGRWPGLVAGIACAALVRFTFDTSDTVASGPTLVGDLARAAVYGGLGYVVGALSETRLGLERKLLRREIQLEELRTLQDALAPPEPPARPSLELATCYIPAEQGVSGDFYVVVPAANGSTLIAIGDVAGRGLVAAKRAWYVRTLLLTSADAVDDPASVLARANRALIDDSGFDAPFVTAACMLFHPNGRLEWALAGHDPPLRLDGGAALPATGRSGLPLGVSSELGCETSVAELSRGSGVLLYTDGLTEARRAPRAQPNGPDLFGARRIEQLLTRLDGASPEQLLERVRDEVSEFCGGSLADDLCMVALRVSGDPEATEVCAPDRVEALSPG